jgi:hypothetical protein
MHRDEQIGFVFVGNLRPVTELYKDIAISGLDDFYIGKVLFDKCARFQNDIQRNVFFFASRANSARIVTAMTGIKYYRLYLSHIVLRRQAKR